MNISNETILSICKSKGVYDKDAKITAEMHDVTEEEVLKIWEENEDIVNDYKENFIMKESE